MGVGSWRAFGVGVGAGGANLAKGANRGQLGDVGGAAGVAVRAAGAMVQVIPLQPAEMHQSTALICPKHAVLEALFSKV